MPTKTAHGEVHTTSGVSATNTLTSVSFTPAAGALLIVRPSLMINDANAGADFTISDTFAGTGTWLLAKTATQNESTFTARTSIWYAVAGASPGSGTITVTRTAGSQNQWFGCFFDEITGQNASPIGATGSNTTTALGATFTVTLSATPDPSSLILGNFLWNDWPGVGSITEPGGYTEDSDVTDSGLGAEMERAFRNGGASSAVTWSISSPGADAEAVAVEILAAAVTAPTIGDWRLRLPQFRPGLHAQSLRPQEKPSQRRPLYSPFEVEPIVTVTAAAVVPVLTIPVPAIVAPPSPAAVQPVLTIGAPGISEAKTASAVIPVLTIPTPAPIQVIAKYVTSVSANGRYFLDQNSDPIFPNGDSPQFLGQMLSTTDMESYFSTRQSQGFNALIVDLIANDNGGANAGGVNFYGDGPFGATLGDLNEPYWAVIDTMFDLAEEYGFTLFATIAETISYGTTWQFATDAEVTNYGTAIGNRYKTRPNAVWIVGNDYQSSQWATLDPKYKKTVDAMIAAGDSHLFTFWLGIGTSTEIKTAWDDSTWASYVGCVGVYRYGFTYYQTELAYAHAGGTKPVFLIESAYEGETLWAADTSDETIRRQAWWVITWGGFGHFFGNHYTWQFLTGWASHMATTVTLQLARIPTIFTGLTGWQNLVPDTGHALVTAGYGTHSTSTNPGPSNSDFATVAKTADGLLGVAYFPDSRAGITVNTAQMTGAVTAHWVDPTNGSTSSESTPAAPTHPGANSVGSHDWVLVLNGTPTTTVSAGAVIPVLTIGAPGIKISALPGAVIPILSVPTPTITATGAPPAPAVIPVLSVPTPAITATGQVTAAAIVPILSVPTPTITATGRPTASAVVPVLSVPTPAITATGQVSTSAIVPVLSIPTPTVTATGVASSAAVQPVLSVPTPTISLTSPGEVFPSAVQPVLSIPTPSITATGQVTATAVQPTLLIGAPTVAIAAVPSAVAPVLSIPTPIIAATGQIAASAVQPILSLPTPTITATGQPTPVAVQPVLLVGVAVVQVPGSAAAQPVVLAVEIPTSDVTASGQVAPIDAVEPSLSIPTPDVSQTVTVGAPPVMLAIEIGAVGIGGQSSQVAVQAVVLVLTIGAATVLSVTPVPTQVKRWYSRGRGGFYSRGGNKFYSSGGDDA